MGTALAQSRRMLEQMQSASRLSTVIAGTALLLALLALLVAVL